MKRHMLGITASNCALVMLLAGVGLAQAPAWQVQEEVFPNHSGCTYFSPGRAGYLGLQAGEDIQAMATRAKDTHDLLATIPRPRSTARPFHLPDRQTPVASSMATCPGIDDCVQRVAQQAGIPLADLTTDAEFLRRVRLDLTGRIPTREEVVIFLADSTPDKRARLVDTLLGMPEWADRWAMFLGDLYKNTMADRNGSRYHARDSLHLYLRNSLRANKPYDQMVRELLSAEGVSDGRDYPSKYPEPQDKEYKKIYNNLKKYPVRASPVGYVIGGRTRGGPPQDTYDTMAYITSRDFLGISTMDCILCHDGEGRLEGSNSAWGLRAKRLEAWGMAAFFSQINRNWRPRVRRPGKAISVRYFVVEDVKRGQGKGTEGGAAGYYLAWTEGGNRPTRAYEPRRVVPAYPFAQGVAVNPKLRLREQIGLYVTSDPQFARAAVNYVWREFFARGIVEPADQFDLDRLDPASLPEGQELQPSHPGLLEWLANGFRESGFDLKWLMREITTSQTYQLSSRYEGVFNPLYERYFVRHNATRLTAEQAHDAILIATGTRARYKASAALGDVQFAMQFPDVVGVPAGKDTDVGVQNLLQVFLPGDRQETPRSRESSPLQALSLMNTPFVLKSLDTGGTLAELVDKPDDELVTGLYLSAFSRSPTSEELAMFSKHLAGAPKGKRMEWSKDLLWALLNRAEFYTKY